MRWRVAEGERQPVQGTMPWELGLEPPRLSYWPFCLSHCRLLCWLLLSEWVKFIIVPPNEQFSNQGVVRNLHEQERVDNVATFPKGLSEFWGCEQVLTGGLIPVKGLPRTIAS